MSSLKRILLGTASLAILTAPAMAQGDLLANFVPVTDEMIQNPDDADWLSWRRTLDHWGYSPLDQINTENVGQITQVWARAMVEGYQEATPLVYDGIMFLAHANDVVSALDATTGDLLWEYRRELPEEGLGLVITRGIGIWEDKIILMSKDNFIVALDATSGEVVWETPIRDADAGYQTAAPVIANGKAISGRNCRPASENALAPENCFVVAHDLQTGEELWRFYTIPQEGQAGYETWGDVPFESRAHVGTWGAAPSFDPELNLVYVGTSVTRPYSKFYWTGLDNLDDEFLYQTSTLAIDADTGELVWYQQHIRDQWDLDHPFERTMVDTTLAPNPDVVSWINPDVVPGQEYRVLTGVFGKTGIFYSLDRATGQFLWATEAWEHQNVVLDIDVQTGRATMNAELIPTAIGQEFFVCPYAGGGKDWMAGAYSPLTNAIYLPMQNICMNSTTGEEDIALSPIELAPGEENVGTIRGISVETGEQLWEVETRAGQASPLLTTGGGLVIGGDNNRRLRALDQVTGEVLWETIVGGQVGGFPISYAVDGRQYIAVPVGASLISNIYLSLTPELQPGSGSNYLAVFALPE